MSDDAVEFLELADPPLRVRWAEGGLQVEGWDVEAELAAWTLAPMPDHAAAAVVALKALATSSEELERIVGRANASQASNARKLDPLSLALAVLVGDEFDQALAAEEAGLPAFCFPLLARSPDRSVRRALAQNPSLSAKVRHQLASDPTLLVGFALLDRTDLEAEDYEALAGHPEQSVRDGVLVNDRAPMGARLRALPDANANIKMVMASRRDTPEELREALGNDSDAIVRQLARSQGNELA